MKVPAAMMVCGTCLVSVVSTIDPGPDDPVRCPQCGQSDRFEDARRVMYEHIKHRLHCAAEEGLAKLDRELGNAPRAVPSDGPSGPVFRWRVTDRAAP